MKTVVLSTALFMAFLVCYEKDMFVLAYVLFGMSLALAAFAIYRGHKQPGPRGDEAGQDGSRKKDAG